MVPGILRRPLAQIAVRKGLPMIDEDDILRDHILAGRTGHPVFIGRLASALDESLDLKILTPPQQTNLAKAVATVLLTPSAATRGLLEQLDARAIALAPTLRHKEDRVALATAINEAIDIPFMDEDQEQVLFESLVDSAAELLDTLLPGELQEALLTGTPEERSFVRAQLVARLEPMIVSRLPMALLARVDSLTAANLTALPSNLANSVVDSTLDYVHQKAPDELFPPAERRARLALREAELRAECSRVEAEAASVLGELWGQITTLKEARRELERAEEEEEEGSAGCDSAECDSASLEGRPGTGRGPEPTRTRVVKHRRRPRICTDAVAAR